MSLTDIASSISASATSASTIISNARANLDTMANFILKPANAKGLGGFVFDYEGDTQIIAQAEITDHYSEQNAFMNDHAAQRPQRITLRGFVAEISQNPDQGVIGVLNSIQGKLTSLPAILGKYTPAAVQKLATLTTTATSVVNKMDNAISRVQNVLGLFGASNAAPSKQQQAYLNLMTLFKNNVVFTLDTPFTYYQSVMIEQVIFVQDEFTKEWSDIVVTVKEIRIFGNPAGPGLPAKQAALLLQGRLAQQGQAQSNRGKTQGVAAAFSSVKSFFTSRN